MEKHSRSDDAIHILALPYPSQGHINPMLQFCKRLAAKGTTTTVAVTKFIHNSMRRRLTDFDVVGLETISDGFDDGGFTQAGSVEAYLERLESAGSKTLDELISRYQSSDHPINCVIYDAFLPWTLEVTEKHGLREACFFTQPCAVNFIYYHAYHRNLKLPVTSPPVSIPGLPPLELQDMPSFIFRHGSYPAYFKLVLNQFLNLEKADFVLVNTFYELEDQVVEEMAKVSNPLLTIGPTLPSFYLDKSIGNDKEYGLNLFPLDSSNIRSIINWLNSKPKGSVVYVAFGSMATLDEHQMEELAWGLMASHYNFLWVVRETEEAKLPKEFLQCISNTGFLIRWGPQLEILSDDAIGCFFSHCGWNSSIEALSLGVPMVVMPQWTDQTTNSKLVEDVWQVGIRVKVDEDGVVGREEIERCIREAMEGEKAMMMKLNAIKWSGLAKEAVTKGGSSDRNIDIFISNLTKTC